MATEAQDILKDVLDYVGLGLPVLELHHPLPGGGCSCDKPDCETPGKHPREKGWPVVETEEDAIERWTRRPQSNIGVRNGPHGLNGCPGVVSIEYDTEEGKASADKLFKEGCFTPTYQTYRGKRWLFRWNDELPKKNQIKRYGLDFGLGNDGGLIQDVLPPSLHFKGVRYRWLPELSLSKVDLIDVPERIVALLWNDDEGLALEELDREVNERAVALECLKHLHPSQATDYWDWILVGMAVHNVDPSLLDDWCEWSKQCPSKYSRAACEAKWASFKPERKHKTVGIGSLVHWAKQNGWKPPWERKSLGVGNKVIIHQSDPPKFKVFLPEFYEGHVELTASQYRQFGSLANEALKQKQAWIPGSYRKQWQGDEKTRALAGELIKVAETQEAPSEDKRIEVVVERATDELARVREDIKEDLDPDGKPKLRRLPVRDAEGGVYFLFTWLWDKLAVTSDKIKRDELIKALKVMGVADVGLGRGKSKRTTKYLPREALGDGESPKQHNEV